MSSRLEANKVATRYAKALFEVALASHAQDAVFQDLQSILNVFQSDASILAFFTMPHVGVEEKRTVLREQFQHALQPSTYQLLDSLVENNRIHAFDVLVDRYKDCMDQHQNITHADVITAVPLDDDLAQRLQDTLARLYGYSRVELHNKVNPEILGGAMVRIQDRIIDGSFKGRLEALREKMTSRTH